MWGLRFKSTRREVDQLLDNKKKRQFWICLQLRYDRIMTQNKWIRDKKEAFSLLIEIFFCHPTDSSRALQNHQNTPIRYLSSRF
jgi:homoserine trans-succinylase